jgi:hypothetical protein
VSPNMVCKHERYGFCQECAMITLEAAAGIALDVERLARALRDFAVAHRDEPDWTHPKDVDWLGDARKIAAAYAKDDESPA